MDKRTTTGGHTYNRECLVSAVVAAPRPVVDEPAPHHMTSRCTVFLGNYGNWDLYGDPVSGSVITRPVSPSCRSTLHGSREYFRGTRALVSSMALTPEGRDW